MEIWIQLASNNIISTNLKLNLIKTFKLLSNWRLVVHQLIIPIDGATKVCYFCEWRTTTMVTPPNVEFWLINYVLRNVYINMRFWQISAEQTAATCQLEKHFKHPNNISYKHLSHELMEHWVEWPPWYTVVITGSHFDIYLSILV